MSHQHTLPVDAPRATHHDLFDPSTPLC
ncbi:hypothetical protein GC175_04475 [bacterium]|nr:hypothetical protein [bacterium]